VVTFNQQHFQKKEACHERLHLAFIGVCHYDRYLYHHETRGEQPEEASAQIARGGDIPLPRRHFLLSETGAGLRLCKFPGDSRGLPCLPAPWAFISFLSEFFSGVSLTSGFPFVILDPDYSC
jgi:hypothetical protein